MSQIWTAIAAVAVLSFLIKAAGPALLGGRPLPDAVRRVVALLAPALLAAFVLVQVAGEHWAALDWRVLVGLAVIAGLAFLRRVPTLVALLVGVVVVALLRQVV